MSPRTYIMTVQVMHDDDVMSADERVQSIIDILITGVLSSRFISMFICLD
jgi:hypothetical protein